METYLNDYTYFTFVTVTHAKEERIFIDSF